MEGPLYTQIGEDLKVAAILNAFFHHEGNSKNRAKIAMPNFLYKKVFYNDSIR